MPALNLKKTYQKYPEYKDSGVDWMGYVPLDWSVQKLKNQFYFTKGRRAALFTAEYIGTHIGSYPVYSGQTENGGVMGKIDSFDYDLSEVIFTTTVGAKAMTPMVLVGKFSLSQNCLLMINRSQLASSKYIFYQLFPLFDREKSMIPSHMQPSLRFSDLSKYPTIYPDIHIQYKIANFLDSKTVLIDQIIKKKQKLISLLQEKRSALITHAVTKGLDPKVKMKPSGIDWIGSIPENWITMPFKSATKFQEGPGIMATDFRDTGIPLLRVRNLKPNYVNVNGCNFLDEEKVKKTWKHFKLKIGDLLISASATMGIVSEVDSLSEGSIAYTGIIRITPILAKSTKDFIKYFVISKTYSSQIDILHSGTAMQHYGPSHLKKIFGIFPPLEEQEKITNVLNTETKTIDNILRLIKIQIDQFDEYRSSLIYHAVTGKIKI